MLWPRSDSVANVEDFLEVVSIDLFTSRCVQAHHACQIVGGLPQSIRQVVEFAPLESVGPDVIDSRVGQGHQHQRHENQQQAQRLGLWHMKTPLEQTVNGNQDCQAKERGDDDQPLLQIVLRHVGGAELTFTLAASQLRQLEYRECLYVIEPDQAVHAAHGQNPPMFTLQENNRKALCAKTSTPMTLLSTLASLNVTPNI